MSATAFDVWLRLGEPGVNYALWNEEHHREYYRATKGHYPRGGGGFTAAEELRWFLAGGGVLDAYWRWLEEKYPAFGQAAV